MAKVEVTKNTSWKPEGYVVPGGSRYVKLQPGANTFRIMSTPIIGWVYFNHEKKPVRTKTKEEIDENDIAEGIYGKQVKHFWTFVVWDYQQKGLSILEMSQMWLINALDAYTNEDDFSDPTKYDIKITKERVGTDTKYTLLALKEKPAPQEAIDAYATTSIHLENLFHYLGDPYGAKISDATLPEDWELPF